jgi:glyoxylase-like metal-dependent hydrolase (beta-lactamase superfamily II)
MPVCKRRDKWSICRLILGYAYWILSDGINPNKPLLIAGSIPFSRLINEGMVHLIDALHLGTPKVISIGLLQAAPGELVLVDTGPASVFAAVAAGVRKLGFELRDVRHILASHIHLDHTGAAWRWAREVGAKIYVHPNGAPHLVNPSKLLSSATRIYGDKMNYLWGATEAIPEEQVIAMTDSDFQLGGLRLRAIATPGHANHHNAYWIKSQRILFAGDVAGVRIGSGPAIPPLPPPEINLELWRDSLEKIRALKPASIYITHFGQVREPTASLDELERRLASWADWIKQRLNEGKSEREIIPEFELFVERELLAGGATEEAVEIYEQADPASMSVAGLARYWRKHHPEEVPAVSGAR